MIAINTRIALLAVLLIAVCGAWCWSGRTTRPSAFPVSMAILEEIHDGKISFVEKQGKIFVHITDRTGDGHVHILDLGRMPEKQALERLKAKQAELQEHDAGHAITAEQAGPIAVGWMQKTYGDDPARGFQYPYDVHDNGTNWRVTGSSVEGTVDGITVMVDKKTGEVQPEEPTH